MAESRTRLKGAKKREPVYSGRMGRVARFVDSAVGLVLPGLAHYMQKRRIQSAALLAFEGAVVDRMMPKEKTGSADAEILPKLQTMRARARRQDQDDSHAMSAADVYVDAVVGDGIKPQATATVESTGASAEVVEAWKKDCKAWFTEWSDEMADATGEGNFFDLQALVARTRKVDGECFTHAVVEQGVAEDGPHMKLSIEVIDADRIDNPDNKQDTQETRSGIKIDTKGRALGYWVASAHPDDVVLWNRVEWKYIEAVEGALSVVQHHKRKRRPGQTRGVPDGASSSQYLDHLHHYLKSEIIGARAASNYALFIKKSIDASDADIRPVDETTEGGTTQSYHENLEAGTIAYLNDGEEPVAFNPNRPGVADSFVVRMLRAIAASHGISYERMARNWSGLSYSAMRGQLKEENRGFDRDRKLLVRQFCRPWYRNVIRHGVQIGRLTPPPSYADNPEPWLAVEWIPPAQGWVDPTKEIKSAKEAIAANLSTPWHESSRSGLDPLEALELNARFLKRAGELEQANGLLPGSLTDGKAVTTGGNPGTNSDPAAPAADPDSGDDDAALPSTPADDTADEAKAAAVEETKKRIDAIGVAFRSGLISSQEADEEKMRVDLGMDTMSDAVREAWEAEPVRRPVTLSALRDAATEAAKDLDDDDETSADPATGEADESTTDDDEATVPAGTEDE